MANTYTLDIKDAINFVILKHKSGKSKEAQIMCNKILDFFPNDPSILHLSGIIEHELGDFEKAIEKIKKAINIFKNNYSDLINKQLLNSLNALGVIYKSRGQITNAIACYKEALEINSNHAETCNNLAIALNFEQKYLDAIFYLEKALEISPNSLEILYNLANTLIETNQKNKLDQALKYYHKIIEINPGFAQAYNQIGNILSLQNQVIEAIKYYKQAIEADINYYFAYNNLGIALKSLENFEEAIVYYKKAIEINENYAEAYYNLAVALRFCDKMDQALENYKKAFELDPSNFSAQHMIASLTGNRDNNLEIAHQEYISKLFDQYSGNFEEHLTETLEYQTPKFLRDFFNFHKQNIFFENAIDLGCGTGLCGFAFHDICKNLIGIDLSYKMLEKAHEKKIYKELIKANIIDFLKNNKKYDLFLASDVFIYIGNLELVFELIKKNSLENSYFIFSVESLEDLNNLNNKNYVLLENGRFAHCKDYIFYLAEKFDFKMACFKKANLRKQNKQWVQGWLFILNA